MNNPPLAPPLGRGGESFGQQHFRLSKKFWTESIPLLFKGGARGGLWRIQLFLYCIVFLPVTLFAQKELHQLAEINIGYPILQEQLPEGYAYNPLFFTYRIPIFAKKNRTFSFYAEPQLAVTTPPKGIKRAIEFGTNLGIQYHFGTTEKQRWTAALGVGPHYISLETAMQHKGFLFSDNLELGYYRLLNTTIGVQLKTRFRHLSNANLQQPNLGLDNLFVMGGVFWKL